MDFDFEKNIILDSGIVYLYGKIIENFCEKLQNIMVKGKKELNDVKRVYNLKKSPQECIDTLDTYECSIIHSGKEILTIPVPVNNNNYDFDKFLSYTNAKKIKEKIQLPKREFNEEKLSGYFIIEGKEKVIISQEKRHISRVVVREMTSSYKSKESAAISQKAEYRCEY
jgi:DNA-directed RNA polymerase beta subunit